MSLDSFEPNEFQEQIESVEDLMKPLYFATVCYATFSFVCFNLFSVNEPVSAAEPITVRIGSKAFTESVILGEALKQLAQSQGAKAVHLAELGGTQVCWKALLAGEIDCYVEYTGTIQQEIVKGEPIRDEESLRSALNESHVRMSRPIGFNNTYALGLTKQTTQKLNIRTLSELARHPELSKLVFRFSDEFLDREDGWKGLSQKYQMDAKDVRGIDHALAYRGLKSGSHQITDVYTTDAEIRYYDLDVLEDDRGYFPVYQAVILYRDDLEQSASNVVESLLQLEGKIDNSRMSELNARTRLDRIDESRVAADFLNEHLNQSIPITSESSASKFAKVIRRITTTTIQHLLLVAVSLSAAILIAIPLGVVAFLKPKLGQAILNTVGIIQTLPSMAVLVFTIPLLGLGAAPAIFALFLYSLLPIVRNTYQGLRDIPSNLRESAVVLGLSRWARLRLVELPLASTSILAGIKTAAVINVGTATIGALVGAGGYGQPILTGIRLDDFQLVMQGAIPAAVLAIVVQAGFGLSERFLIPAGLRIRKSE